jgi:uncharacterized protein YbjT (DUF2867 family)
MKTLIIGGTGTVGSQVVRRLLKKGYELRVLTTSREKAEKLPPEVEPYIGSLEYTDTLAGAFKNVDKVFMLNAHTKNEIYQGLNAIAAAVNAGVSKFVYQSIHQVRGAVHIEHFRSKVFIEEALKRSGLNYVFVCPNNFYQNDFWFKDSITKARIYNQPLGSVGLSRVDVRDIAEVVEKVLETDRYDRQTIALAGPEVLTGESTAEILSQFLGYQVNYIGDDLQVFKDAFYQWLPQWMVDDWAGMYEYFHHSGLKANEKELQQLKEILGREPLSYRQFLEDHLIVFAS